MAKYHIYGIGNALVDKEFEVEDSFFTDLNIEKGMMTLIEEDQLAERLAVLNDRALKNVPVVAAPPIRSLVQVTLVQKPFIAATLRMTKQVTFTCKIWRRLA